MSKSAGLLEAMQALGVRYAAEQRYASESQQAAPSTVLSWAERYRELDGQPFNLDRFEPLREIYADPHPDIVVIKPAQRGVSEWAINYASFALERGAELWSGGLKDALNVGYIFPTKVALEDFSKERISGLEEESAYLQALFADGDNFNGVTFKQVESSLGGKSHLYLRGGWSTRALKSFPADMIILDEYDEMATGAPALAWRRTNASPCRRRLRISTPTIPGRGIHELYLQSDRRVYEQQHRCGAWVSFDFWHDVRVDGARYDTWKTWPSELIRASDVRLHCPDCGAPLSEEERCARGRWRIEAPDMKGLRGYWVPWWPFPVVDLVEYAVTAVSQDPSELTELYRSDLGAPYESSGSRITREMLAALSHDLPGGQLPDQTWHATTLGADIGKRLHYRISSLGDDGRRYIRAMGSVASWDELDTLMGAWMVSLAVLDALPEMHEAARFVERHPGRAVVATYPTTANALKGVLWAPEDQAKVLEDGRVQINRTMAMDAVYAAVAKRAESWPAGIHNDHEVVEHMTAPVRVETIDAHGQSRPDWVHTKPDHLYHASVYEHIARELVQAHGFTGGMFAVGAARDSRVRR